MLLSLVACQKELSFENAGPGYPATGFLDDASGDCLPYSVHGTWYNGVSPRDTNYVDITVRVTRAGTYQIKTNQQNGVSFSGSGIFTDTGLNTARLTPTGTFLQHVPSSFTTSFDGSSCQFMITVQDSTGTGLGGGTGGGTGGGGTGGGTGGASLSDNTWQFTANGHVYSGTAQASVTDVPAIPAAGMSAYTLFAIVGQTATPDTLFSLAAKMSGTSIAKGTFKTSSIPNQWYFNAISFTSGTSTPIFAADPTISGKVINITITAYDASTKTVTGSFDGTSRGAGGASVGISNSGFKVILQ